MPTNTNHIRYRLFIGCLLFAFLAPLTSAGALAYNVYYGQLHSHSKDSDGSGTPAQTYQYARDTAKLDFFSLADHCSYPYGANDGLTVAEYQNQQSIANSYNQDGVYVTFWGFEWTSDDTSWGGPSTLLGKGHITIINSPDHCEADEEATNDLNELVDWLSTRDAVAFFNHPGQYGYDFDNFLFNHSDKIVGMELWNRSDDYYGTGSWYHNALGKGWYIGATGSQDNHSANWGTMNEWRMAILAPELTRASLLDAMKARRFYSSRDKNLVLSFTCNGAQMGSKIDGGLLDVVIDTSDGNSEIFSKIELLKNGTIIETWTPNTTHPHVTTTAAGTQGDYFYVRVQQSGESGWRAISSPIFISSDTDVTTPTPDPMTFAPRGTPRATGSSSIVMIATTASDPSGVEYYFDETSGNPGGSDSGWQDSTSYTDTGLSPTTQYTYTVKARDKSANQNTTVDSAPVSVTTWVSVDAGVDMITWSGEPVQLNGTGYGGISSYAWSADPDDGVDFSATDIEDPTVTITKATDNPSTVMLILVGDGTFTDTMAIDVYDDACQAAIGMGLAADYPADFDRNCVINFDDFALMATTWLNDTGLTEPVPK